MRPRAKRRRPRERVLPSAGGSGCSLGAATLRASARCAARTAHVSVSITRRALPASIGNPVSARWTRRTDKSESRIRTRATRDRLRASAAARRQKPEPPTLGSARQRGRRRLGRGPRAMWTHAMWSYAMWSYAIRTHAGCGHAGHGDARQADLVGAVAGGACERWRRDVGRGIGGRGLVHVQDQAEGEVEL